MNILTATTTGAGLGLVLFGSLWLDVRRLVERKQGKRLVAIGSVARLVLAAGVFYGLSRESSLAVIAGLAGVWLARGCLIRQWGRAPHGV